MEYVYNVADVSYPVSIRDQMNRARWLVRKAFDLLYIDQAAHFLRSMLDGFDALRPRLEQSARERGAELLEAHRRVRTASRARGVTHCVEPQLPPDVLGTYIYLPYNSGGQ